MKTLPALAALVAGAVALSAAFVVTHSLMTEAPTQATQGAADLPWQIDVLPDGSSRVMGMTLGTADRASRLGDARTRWGDKMTVAIVAAPGEVGTLEAFVDPLHAGFITGKLVISAALDDNAITAMKARAAKVEFMDSTTRRFTLDATDLAVALAAPITALGFIPQANLDEQVIASRFGTPAERHQVNDDLAHFLYPDKGLDIALSAKGKELLQYVAPSEFEARLRAPLLKAPSASAPTP